MGKLILDSWDVNTSPDDSDNQVHVRILDPLDLMRCILVSYAELLEVTTFGVVLKISYNPANGVLDSMNGDCKDVFIPWHRIISIQPVHYDHAKDVIAVI